MNRPIMKLTLVMGMLAACTHSAWAAGFEELLREAKATPDTMAVLPVPTGEAVIPQRQGLTKSIEYVQCVQDAYSSTILSKESAKLLCQGAVNSGPVQCFKEAYKTILTKDESIMLCTKARDTAPALCFKQANSSIHFTKQEALQMCMPGNDHDNHGHHGHHDNDNHNDHDNPGDNHPGGNHSAECYSAAYNSLSQDQAKRLCAGAVNLGPVNCFNVAYSTVLTKEESIETCVGARDAGPAECFQVANRLLSKDEARRLCKYAKNTAPVACYKKAYENNSKDEAIQMCVSDRPHQH